MARHSQSSLSFKLLLLILAVLELWLTVPECDAVQVKISKPGRSSIWDREMHRQRERTKRDTQCIMQTAERSCTLPDVTRHDTLGRRNSGLLVDVEDQGSCGSCWAFAATHGFADLRGLSSGRKGALLSPEYATRCVTTRTGNGCCGGRPSLAARHFKETGMVTNQCLPYGLIRYQRNLKASNPVMCSSTCRDNSPLNPASIKLVDYRYFYGKDDNAIMIQLQSGPVVVGMTARGPFMNYECGIYCNEVVHTASQCKIVGGKHAVEIVDYGTSDTGVDFWVVKNSWGSDWGEDGYFRIRRGDLCIGKLDVVFLYASSGISQGTSNEDTSVPTCSAIEVADPNNNLYSESAAEYGINELARLRLIPCPDGSNATNITLRSISDATTQIVSGAIVNLTVSANLVGCEAGTASVTIEMFVFIDTDGNFTLSTYEFSRNSPDGACIVGYSPIMIFIAFLLLFGLFTIG